MRDCEICGTTMDDNTADCRCRAHADAAVKANEPPETSESSIGGRFLAGMNERPDAVTGLCWLVVAVASYGFAVGLDEYINLNFNQTFTV